MKPAAKVYTAIIMIFLFAPIAILLVFSFNEAKSLSVFSGFSLNWYRELFRDAETLGAVRNTLILAASAALISTVMGTAAAVGINKLRNRALRIAMDTVTNIPMVNPDIITGISLMLMFVFVGRLFGAATSLNFACPMSFYRCCRSSSRWTARCPKQRWISAVRRCARL